MRAVVGERFGGPEVLVAAEWADPVPAAGQVVVEVAAADTLHIETVIRAGGAREFFAVTPPFVLGGAVAGRVSAVGEGVDPELVGRRVAGRTVAFGGYAEKALVAADLVVGVPDGVTLETAAALQHDALTGLALVEPAPVEPGKWVLVTAAAGGMGVLLVQLAKAAGAKVIGAARGGPKLDLVRRSGADGVVDYSEPDWPVRVREATGGAGADVVFDGAGGEIGAEAFELTVPGGWFSGHGAAGGGFAAVDTDRAARAAITQRGIGDVQLGPDDQRRFAAEAMRLAADGTIEPYVGATYQLARAADAHRAIESRTVPGKTLLVP